MVFIPYTNLDQLLLMWENMGIFSVLIPFVLIFAVVFAILNKSEILGNKPAIQAIIAIAIALGAIQFDFTIRFFTKTFFQNLGVGLIILLGLLILVGLFMGGEGKEAIIWRILGAVVGFIVFLAVLIKSYGNVAWRGSAFWSMYGGYVIIAIIIVGLILLVTLTNKQQRGSRQQGST